MHDNHITYGANAWKMATQVEALAHKYKATSILDYGCGKATLKTELKRRGRVKEETIIHSYDPAIPSFEDGKTPSDLVVCLDVMEHIERGCLSDVVVDIKAMTKKALFVRIATRPSKKLLPDGRNPHLIVENGPWWFYVFDQWFDIIHYENHLEGQEVFMECV